MKHYLLAFTLLLLSSLNAQTKNFIDQPYVETFAVADTIIQPDLIYLTIILNENDNKNKISLEKQENDMARSLTSLGINLKTQLSLSDLNSNFKKYFLRQKDIMKSKAYTLKVYNAQTAGKVIAALENVNISNVNLEKTEYSKIEEVKLDLREKAMVKARNQAERLLRPLKQKVAGAIFISDNFSFGNLDDNMHLQEVVVMGYSSKKNEEYEPIEIEFKPITVSCTVTAKLKIE